MARATNTYAVRGSLGDILAVFTVKWECAAWLERINQAGLKIERYPDGRYLTDRGCTARWTAEEFLAE